LPRLSKCMIIVLHGSDEYRSDQKLKEIIAGYKKKNKSGLNLIYLEKNPTFEDLKDESRQLGMFEEKRLIVGKEVLNKKIKKKIIDNLEKLADSENILILKEDEKIKGKFSKEIEKLSKRKGMIKEYEKLKGRQLKSWYKKEISKFNVKITSQALSKLVNFIGNDLWRAKNEVSKLATMKDREKIEVKDVVDYIRPEIETDIFKTVDALGAAKKDKAVELIEKHLKDGDSPFYLISMINYQVRNLLTLKELQKQDASYNEIKRKSKLNPFVIKKTKAQAKNFNFDKLKKIHRNLFAVDLSVKSGEMSPETALTLIISQF